MVATGRAGVPGPAGLPGVIRVGADVAGSLSQVTRPGVVERSIGHFRRADAGLGSRLDAAVAALRK